ncbi:MAG: hypothetical protein FWC46_02050 [Actinomycetia bacterium]|nr:hypothetical protein [Actinomycetes bacterium]
MTQPATEDTSSADLDYQVGRSLQALADASASATNAAQHLRDLLDYQVTAKWGDEDGPAAFRSSYVSQLQAVLDQLVGGDGVTGLVDAIDKMSVNLKAVTTAYSDADSTLAQQVNRLGNNDWGALPTNQ